MATALTVWLLCLFELRTTASNWIAYAASTARPGCEGFVLDIVALVRQDYDLPAQQLLEAVTRLVSGRNLPL